MSYLSSVLELILNTMVASSLPLDAAPVADITETLESDHDISSEVTQQVMSWFGKITRSSSTETVWDTNVENIVRQLGIGLLSGYRVRFARFIVSSLSSFLSKWALLLKAKLCTECSNSGRKFYGKMETNCWRRVWGPSATIASFGAFFVWILHGQRKRSPIFIVRWQGNYICRSSQEGRTLAYFPSSELPVLPSDRFSDLFLTQSRWRADEIAPFLKEIAVDSKERDKLLMKYARTMTDSEGQIWYTSRSNAI